MKLKDLTPLETKTLLERHLAQRRALKDIAQHLASGKSPATVLSTVLAAICQTVGAAGARVILANEDNTTYGAGPRANDLAVVDDRLWAFMTKAVVVPDIEDAPPNLELEALAGVISSLVTLPLTASDEQQGVLWLGFEASYDLPDDQYDFLELVAVHLASFIANQPEPGITMSGIEVAQVLANATDALLIMDNDGHILLVNTLAQDLFELGDDVLGKSFYEQIDSPLLHKMLRGEITHGDDDDLHYIAPDERSFKPSVSPIIGKHGLQVGVLMVLWEITRFKRINENMSMFLHTVSHDLRSPLTAAKGFVDMLGMVGEVNDKQKTMIGKILTSINDMTNLVEKVLDAGRLDPEMGTYELRREPSDPSAIISKVASTLSSAAAQKSITLDVDAAPDLPVLNIDPMMIERALVNLVENAIKYTPENSHVRFGGLIENDALVLFVEDNGPGIPPEDQERLFEKGERLVKKGERKVRGSGLGLFIVKNVAQQHGGRAYVESEADQGSRFIITIPLDGANLLGGGATGEA